MSDEPLFVYRPSETRHLRRSLWFWLLPGLVAVAALYASGSRDVGADGLGGAFFGSIAIASGITLMGWANDRYARRSSLVLSSGGELVVEKHRPPPLGPVRVTLDSQGISELSVSSDQETEMTVLRLQRPGVKAQTLVVPGAMGDAEIEGLFDGMRRFSPDLRVGWQGARPIGGKQWFLFGRNRLRERSLARLVRALDDYQPRLEAEQVDLKVVMDAINNRVRIEVAGGDLPKAKEILSNLTDPRYQLGIREGW